MSHRANATGGWRTHTPPPVAFTLRITKPQGQAQGLSCGFQMITVPPEPGVSLLFGASISGVCGICYRGPGNDTPIQHRLPTPALCLFGSAHSGQHRYVGPRSTCPLSGLLHSSPPGSPVWRHNQSSTCHCVCQSRFCSASAHLLTDTWSSPPSATVALNPAVWHACTCFQDA